SIERHHNDLTAFLIPRLRACAGPLVTHQVWAAEVREDIEGLARQVEELDVLVDDQRTERARRELRTRVEVFRDSLTNLRKDSRAALLASKHAIDAQSWSLREELLRSSSLREKCTSSSSEKSAEDTLTKANRGVTEALQRTIGLMQKELEHSVLSTQLLESSTATLQSASTAQDTLNLVIGTSKQLITVLEKTDWLDRVLIISALVFVGLVVLFILKSRIIDRGLRIAFFWTRLLPSSSARAGGEVLVTASANGAAASATLASLIAGQHGGAAELIEPSMDAYEFPGFTMPAMEPWTTEQHIRRHTC
ncbi:hypothetical protein M405DRAFT_806476, partial [Rhizopogon salebrosus TDB-379]